MEMKAMLVCGSAVDEVKDSLETLTIHTSKGSTLTLGADTTKELIMSAIKVANIFASDDMDIEDVDYDDGFGDLICEIDEVDEGEEKLKEMDYEDMDKICADVVTDIMAEYSAEELLDMDENRSYEVIDDFLYDSIYRHGFKENDEDTIDLMEDTIYEVINERLSTM